MLSKQERARRLKVEGVKLILKSWEVLTEDLESEREYNKIQQKGFVRLGELLSAVEDELNNLS